MSQARRRTEELLRLDDGGLALQLAQQVARERLDVQRHLLARLQHRVALRVLKVRRLPPHLVSCSVDSTLGIRQVGLEL